jgi:hypothetical protein
MHLQQQQHFTHRERCVLSIHLGYGVLFIPSDYTTIVPLAFQLVGVVAGALERGQDPVGIAKQAKRTRQSDDAQ